MLTTCARRAGKCPLNGIIGNLDSTRSFHIAIMAQKIERFSCLNGLVARNLDPGLIFVNTGFAWQSKNLLTQDVAHDFAGAAFNRVCP